jgi:hypothetical protein
VQHHYPALGIAVGFLKALQPVLYLNAPAAVIALAYLIFTQRAAMAVFPVTEFCGFVFCGIFLKGITAAMGNNILDRDFSLLKVVYIKTVPAGMHTHIYQKVIVGTKAFLFTISQRLGVFSGVVFGWFIGFRDRAATAYQM